MDSSTEGESKPRDISNGVDSLQIFSCADSYRSGPVLVHSYSRKHPPRYDLETSDAIYAHKVYTQPA